MTRKNMTLKFCKADILAIAMVAALAILVSIIFWTSVGSEEGNMVMIYQEGKLIQELSLDHDTEFVIEGDYENVVTVKDGKAAITKSDCPGTDCVHSGWIHEAGRSIVCLPNRVELRIEGASEVDFVVR
ncbi:MAG: NusG domain II-containing protein [Lachnospiraceae bacterium]|nr:NusG domain II-containing protein [Lachnospiraceae bacterium]